MKKTIAAAGAVTLGLGGAVLGAAMPASAVDPSTDPCADYTEHVPAVGGVSGQWYMDCIPVYGVGKVEFDLTSPVDFPDDFSFIDIHSTVGVAGETYFQLTEPNDRGIIAYGLNAAIVDRVADIRGQVIIPIDEVEAILPTALPAGCQSATFGYANAYQVSYLPVTITSSQVINGVTYSYQFTYAPPPMQLGLNILNTGAFDVTKAQCAASDAGALFAVDATDPLFDLVTRAFATRDNFNTLVPYTSATIETGDGGDFAFINDDYIGVVTLANDIRVLPATGPTPAPLAVVAGGLLAAGLAVLSVLGIRRRRAL
jgi:LPXTG-motif cell wall-anchored protein